MSNTFLRPANESTITGALLWRNFAWHAQRVCIGTLGHRVVHAIITFLECFPGASQIVSLFELFIVKWCLHQNVVAKKEAVSLTLVDHLKQKFKGNHKIEIRYNSETIQTLQLNSNHPELTVEALKYMVQTKIPDLNMDKIRIRLIQNGKLLKNELPLSKCTNCPPTDAFFMVKINTDFVIDEWDLSKLKQ